MSVFWPAGPHPVFEGGHRGACRGQAVKAAQEVSAWRTWGQLAPTMSLMGDTERGLLGTWGYIQAALVGRQSITLPGTV